MGEGSNCGSELIWLNRLGQVSVEAGLHRFVALLLSGVGGESDSRNLSPTLCQKLLDFGVMVDRDLAEGPPVVVGNRILFGRAGKAIPENFWKTFATHKPAAL